MVSKASALFFVYPRHSLDPQQHRHDDSPACANDNAKQMDPKNVGTNDEMRHAQHSMHISTAARTFHLSLNDACPKVQGMGRQDVMWVSRHHHYF